MCATGHDQQWRSRSRILKPLGGFHAGGRECFEDQRVGDGSDRAAQLLSGSTRGGHRLIEHAHPARQPSGLQNLVHGSAVGVQCRYHPSHGPHFLIKQKDPVTVTRPSVLSTADLSNDFFQCARELGRFVGVEFHDEPTAALERNPHDDATSLLGDFHRAVTRPRFHCCHRASSSCSYPATCRLNYSVPPSRDRSRVLAEEVFLESDSPQAIPAVARSEEHTSELQSRLHLVCRLLLEKKNRYQ